MAKSYFGIQKTDYVLNNYNVERFDENHFLITTEHGAWAVLSAEEYELFRHGRVKEDPALFGLLEDKGLIVSKENVGEIIHTYRGRKSFLFFNPGLHIITPTMRCNAKCIYCHSCSMPPKSKGYDLDFETGKKIIDFIFSFPRKILTIEFQGGDCLLNYGVTEKIIDYAQEKAKKKNRKLYISLVSNMTLMTDEIAKSLGRRRVVGLATSFDGPREVQNKNRPYIDGSGTYADVVYWIKRLKNRYRFNFNLNALCTITRHSFGHEKEIVDEYLKLGFDSIWIRPLNNLGYAKGVWKEIGYSPQEFVSSRKKAMDYIFKKNREGSKIIELFVVLFAKKIMSSWSPMMVDFQSPCGAAIGQILYNYRGEIFPCDESKVLPEFRLGNVRDSKIKDIITHPTTISLMDISSKKNFLCDRCPWEPYCAYCPVDAHAREGSIVSKLAQNERCFVEREIIRGIFEKFIYSPKDTKVIFDWLDHQTVFA